MAVARRFIIVSAVLIAAAPALLSAADKKLVVGIPPFDVAAVEGVDESASQVLAKLIRIELLKNPRLQPVLMPAASSDDAPASSDDNAPAAERAENAVKTDAVGAVDVVLKGTVLSADVEQSSQDVSPPSLFGGNLNIGGRVGRTTATVGLHVDLADPKTGDTIDSFDVESKESATGVGTDLSTAAGSFNSGDASFDKSPMGKALRGAAQKVAAELTKRAGKLTPQSKNGGPS